jgi:hypothetical protein
MPVTKGNINLPLGHHPVSAVTWEQPILFKANPLVPNVRWGSLLALLGSGRVWIVRLEHINPRKGRACVRLVPSVPTVQQKVKPLAQAVLLVFFRTKRKPKLVLHAKLGSISHSLGKPIVTHVLLVNIVVEKLRWSVRIVLPESMPLM